MPKGWSRRRSSRRGLKIGTVIFAVLVSAVMALLVYGCTEWYGNFFTG